MLSRLVKTVVLIGGGFFAGQCRVYYDNAKRLEMIHIINRGRGYNPEPEHIVQPQPFVVPKPQVE